MNTNEWVAAMRGIKSIIGLSFYFRSCDDIIYIKYVHTIYHYLDTAFLKGVYFGQ